MKKTSKSGGDVFNWTTVSKAARSPETRSLLRGVYGACGNLIDACTTVEDQLEFAKGRLAKLERDRLRVVRRIGEGV